MGSKKNQLGGDRLTAEESDLVGRLFYFFSSIINITVIYNDTTQKKREKKATSLSAPEKNILVDC